MTAQLRTDDWLRIEVDPGRFLDRQFDALERDNLPYAMQQATNKVADEVKVAWRYAMQRSFDRPTPLTLNAVIVRKASYGRNDDGTRSSNPAEIYIRNEAHGGTPPARYLLAQVQGGQRMRTPKERLLAATNVLPASHYITPGPGARLDAYGNVRAAEVSRILSQIGARRDAYQNESEHSRERRQARAAKRGTRGGNYFALTRRRGRLAPGVYERITTGFGSAVRSVLRFVQGARYQPRLQIFDVAQRTWDRFMPFYFNRELRKAVESSKWRWR